MIPGLGRSPGEGKGYLFQFSWASFMAQLVKNLPAVGDLGLITGWKEPLQKERLPTPVFRPGELHGLYSLWGRIVSQL